MSTREQDNKQIKMKTKQHNQSINENKNDKGRRALDFKRGKEDFKRGKEEKIFLFSSFFLSSPSSSSSSLRLVPPPSLPHLLLSLLPIFLETWRQWSNYSRCKKWKRKMLCVEKKRDMCVCEEEVEVFERRYSEQINKQYNKQTNKLKS